MWAVLDMGRALPCLWANYLGPVQPQPLIVCRPKPIFMDGWGARYRALISKCGPLPKLNSDKSFVK